MFNVYDSDTNDIAGGVEQCQFVGAQYLVSHPGW